MCCGGGFDVDNKIEQIEMLERMASGSDFWNDQAQAQTIMRDLTRLQHQVTEWQSITKRLSEAHELAELGDKELQEEVENEVAELAAAINRLEFETLLAAKYDDKPALLAIHAGAGGTEAQDWAEMLQRMFIRWAERKGFVVDIVDYSAGDEAGLKSVLMAINGEYAYGYLKSERGVHRLVRISPFDGSARRHTSFAKIEVWPDVAEEIEIEIDEKDLEYQRFKASGAGGQHVQKNETAVRIKHLPTGLVVSCQNQRSLTQNIEFAMKVLKSQLFDLAQRQQDAEMARLKGEDVDAGWGNQIRSYVLHPYKMVKDHRTNHETGRTQTVLDGDLDSFMQAYLKQHVDDLQPV